MKQAEVLLLQLEKQQSLQLPWVIYKLPHSNQIAVFLEENVVLTTEERIKSQSKRFVFAPFDTDTHLEKTLYVNADQTIEFPLEEVLANPCQVLKSQQNSVSEKSKEIHINRVANAIDFLKKNHHEKVVISSRFELQETPKLFPETLYKKLEVFYKACITYPNTFTYLIFHPQIENTWIGASPELLLRKEGKQITSVALAGTRGFSNKNDVKNQHKSNDKTSGVAPWSTKNIEEQDAVTQYISSIFKKYAKDITVSDKSNFGIGKLSHLINTFTAELIDTVSKNSIYDLVQELHPTPAVCGFPTKLTKEFILKNELHQRKYYSGYLGIEDLTRKDLEYYVNIRCAEMSTLNKQIYLYAGGGITTQSKPENEWQEALAKAHIMGDCFM